MYPRRLRHLLACICSLVVALGLLSESSRAPGQARRESILPREGTNALKDADRKVGEKYKALREGSEPASKDNPEHMKVIDHKAQWYAYRLTWPEFHDKANGMTNLFDQIKSELELLQRSKPANQAYIDLFQKEFAKRLGDVLQTDRPIASVNAARALVLLVRNGSVEAADILDTAVKAEGLNEAAKYWALVGLGQQLAMWNEAPGSGDAAAPANAQRKARELRYVQTLIEALDHKPPYDLKTVALREEREGLREGMRFFRRAAVRSLAQCRSPGLNDDKGALVARPAQALLRVMNNDGFWPAVRLDEQVEAAVGVALMKARLMPTYQPDYSARLLGYFVVDYAARSADKINRPTVWEKEFWDRSSRPYTARLIDSLEAMRADTKTLKDAKVVGYVEQVATRALKVLRDVEASGNSSQTSDLKFWLDSNPSPSTTLFQGVADSTVKPLSAAEDEDDRPQPKKPEKPTKKPEAPAKKPEDKKGGGPKKP